MNIITRVNLTSLKSAGKKIKIDYAFKSEKIALPWIWMSFFDTEEAHAVVLAKGAGRGGRYPSGTSQFSTYGYL